MVKRTQAHRSNQSHDKKSRELEQLFDAIQEGRFQHVVDVLSSRLRTGKRSPTSLYLLGLAWRGLDDPAQGAKYFEESIACGGDPTAAQRQLARVYFVLERFADSASVLQKLIEATPDQIEVWRNLILALENADRIDDALVECQKAIERFPNDTRLFSQLGDLYQAKEDWPKAAGAYHRCVELDATREDSRKLHIAMLRRIGDREAICNALDRWLEVTPNNPIAEHLRGAYSEDFIPSRASDEYVREVFDQFAATFDSHLTALQYQAPRCLGEHLRRLPLRQDRSLHVLDAGCGTGLLGAWLRPFADKLDGVDLSSQMLARAEKLGLYDALVEAELTAFLATKMDVFDLIASADTLNYFGDLRPFLLAARGALRSVGGWLVFTLESGEQPGYSLQPSGRYTHSIEPVSAMLSECGFMEIQVESCVLRQEAGRDVRGVVFSAEWP